MPEFLVLSQNMLSSFWQIFLMYKWDGPCFCPQTEIEAWECHAGPVAQQTFTWSCHAWPVVSRYFYTVLHVLFSEVIADKIENIESKKIF